MASAPFLGVDMRAFENKVVFITGASSGIGAALAKEFARAGANLVILARREERLAKLSSELEQLGRKAIAIRCDVTKDGDLENATRMAVEHFGRIDVVVANAGFGVVGPVERLQIDDFRRQFETNVFGVLRTIYATLEELKKTKGVLVLLGSVSSYISGPNSAPYSMSKYAVRALAESLYCELAPYGIGVTLICPGFVKSEIRQIDNRGVLHENARDPVPSWLVMPTDKAARDIVAAVRRRRREKVITLHGKAAVLLSRVAPSIVALAFRMGVRQGMQKRDK